MDATTVPTPPVSRQSHEHEWILIREGLTTELSPEGIEVTVMQGERKIPESWTDAQASIALHKDGSHCNAKCGCLGRESLTTISCGETAAIGDWVWYVDATSWVVGWHRTGPSDAEQRLQRLLEERDEDLGCAEYYHDMTKVDLAASEERRGKLRATLRRSRKTAAAAEHRHSIAFQAAWAGWSAAILLAAYLIESVI